MDAHSYQEWVRTEKTCVFIPVGAHEQHGPHLPMGTDALLSTIISESVAADMHAKVAPAFAYGYKSQQRSGGGDHLPGTVSLDAEALIKLTRTVVGELLDQGVQNVVLVNGHYENYQFLYEGVDLALADLGLQKSGDRAVLLLSYWDYVSEETLSKVYPDGFPGWEVEHGGVLETSLMLHLRPDLVQMERAQNHPAAEFPRFDRLPVAADRTPASGCLSSPAGADAKKGELLFGQVVEELSADMSSEIEL
ncbi:creatininase [Nocardiopsis xinjiangensis]|uniref:creatininase n=1 Tax=Nocardiopsis xinjiangensis TaxID=124285 RepID=UPI000524E195|nr:creatininase [Nocardiopsis xinjiangensis]